MKDFYRIFGGIALIIIGFLIWFSNLGVMGIAWNRDWPIILIIIGIIELIKHIITKK